MSFVNVTEAHNAAYTQLLIDDPDFLHTQIVLWKAAESVPKLTFIEQAMFGDYVIRNMLAEDESIWRPFVETILDVDIPYTLQEHDHTAMGFGNMAYIISRLRPNDPLWFRCVQAHTALLKDIKPK
jgi:hypothetical protein